MTRTFAQRTLAVGIAVLLVSIVWLTTPITEHHGGYDSDGRYYGAMAGAPGFPTSFTQTAPWAYRIVTPYLASLLPFDPLASFSALAFISNVLSIIVFALIMQHFALSRFARGFGILLYVGSFWVLKFSFYAPAYIDHQKQLFLLLIIYLSLRKHFIFLPLVLAVAALQKESLAVYALFSVVCFWRTSPAFPPKARAALTGAMLVAPFAALFIARSAIDVVNAYSPTVIIHHLQSVLAPSFWPILLQAGFSGLGVIPFIVLIGWKTCVAFLRAHWEWVVYLIISFVFLFGGSDKARLFLYMLPLAAILAAAVIDRLEQRIPPAVLVAWGSGMLLAHFYMGGYLTPMGTFAAYIAQWVPEYSAGDYVAYLARNLAIVALVLTWTVFCFRIGTPALEARQPLPIDD